MAVIFCEKYHFTCSLFCSWAVFAIRRFKLFGYLLMLCPRGALYLVPSSFFLLCLLGYTWCRLPYILFFVYSKGRLDNHPCSVDPSLQIQRSLSASLLLISSLQALRWKATLFKIFDCSINRMCTSCFSQKLISFQVLSILGHLTCSFILYIDQ